MPENTLEEHDADKSQLMADSVGIVIDRSCEDPEGQMDEDARSRLKMHVRHFAADQCSSAIKCGKLLATGGQFANLVWVSHDPAHQVRIACKDPLHAMPEFQEQWERLFAPGKKKHALIPMCRIPKSGRPGLWRLSKRCWLSTAHRLEWTKQFVRFHFHSLGLTRLQRPC